MARNPIATNIVKIIAKIERNIEYYENKANYHQTFLRDGKVYDNTEEWKAYWLSISEYWNKEVEEYYKLLRYVNKEGLGELAYPQSPINKREIVK